MSKFIDMNGLAHVKVISPGQGTSAYYKEDQLKRDTSAFVGGLSFIDHPGKSEQRDRPERSLRDLVGPIVGKPVYEAQGKSGPGVYGSVKVAKHWRPFIEELGSTLGISIRASGSATMESIGGKKVKVAEKFNPGAGFDFVTQAGRGGKMVSLLESATAVADGIVSGWLGSTDFTESEDGRSEEERFLSWVEKGQEDQMEKNEKDLQPALTAAEAKITAYKEQVTTLTTENARLAEALGLRQAQDAITEALSKDTVKLPTVTKERIIKTLSESAPLVEGKLDTGKLTEMIIETIKTESEYVESITKKPGITGMGGGTPPDDGGHQHLIDRKVKGYMKAGYSEADAKQMAERFAEGR